MSEPQYVFQGLSPLERLAKILGYLTDTVADGLITDALATRLFVAAIGVVATVPDEWYTDVITTGLYLGAVGPVRGGRLN